MLRVAIKYKYTRTHTRGFCHISPIFLQPPQVWHVPKRKLLGIVMLE